MKGWVYEEYSGLVVLKYSSNVTVPGVNDDQVFVKVVAAALNPVDFKRRLGKFQATDFALPSRVKVFVQCDEYEGGAVVGRVVIIVEMMVERIVIMVEWWDGGGARVVVKPSRIVVVGVFERMVVGWG
ncbi:putative 2-methylene-furan-3-one reductase [Helianthus anomalus]